MNKAIEFEFTNGGRFSTSPRISDFDPSRIINPTLCGRSGKKPLTVVNPSGCFAERVSNPKQLPAAMRQPISLLNSVD